MTLRTAMKLSHKWCLYWSKPGAQTEDLELRQAWQTQDLWWQFQEGQAQRPDSSVCGQSSDSVCHIKRIFPIAFRGKETCFILQDIKMAQGTCREVRRLQFSSCVCAKWLQSYPTLCDPVDCIPPGSSVGFSRQEYWSGLPFPPPGHLSDPGIEPASLSSSTLAGVFFSTSTTWDAPVLILTVPMAR